MLSLLLALGQGAQAPPRARAHRSVFLLCSFLSFVRVEGEGSFSLSLSLPLSPGLEGPIKAPGHHAHPMCYRAKGSEDRV